MTSGHPGIRASGHPGRMTFNGLAKRYCLLRSLCLCHHIFNLAAGSVMKKMLNIRLDASLKEVIDKRSSELGMTLTEYVTRALKQYAHEDCPTCARAQADLNLTVCGRPCTHHGNPCKLAYAHRNGSREPTFCKCGPGCSSA